MFFLPITREQLLQVLTEEGVTAEIGVAKGDFSKHILETTAAKKLHLVNP